MCCKTVNPFLRWAANGYGAPVPSTRLNCHFMNILLFDCSPWIFFLLLARLLFVFHVLQVNSKTWNTETVSKVSLITRVNI